MSITIEEYIQTKEPTKKVVLPSGIEYEISAVSLLKFQNLTEIPDEERQAIRVKFSNTKQHISKQEVPDAEKTYLGDKFFDRVLKRIGPKKKDFLVKYIVNPPFSMKKEDGKLQIDQIKEVDEDKLIVEIIIFSGELYGSQKEHVFNVGWEHINCFHNKKVSKELIRAFDECHYELSINAVITEEEKEGLWKLIDKSNVYYVEDNNIELKIFKPKKKN